MGGAPFGARLGEENLAVRIETSQLMIKVLGCIAMASGVGYALTGLLFIMQHPPRSISDIKLFTVVALFLFGVGLGLYHRRMLAAVGFSLLLVYLAYWEVQGAMHPLPGYDNWIGFVLAGLLLLPLALLAISGKALVKW
jgi:hypothetical protein